MQELWPVRLSSFQMAKTPEIPQYQKPDRKPNRFLERRESVDTA
jgi:hypothetical protein